MSCVFTKTEKKEFFVNGNHSKKISTANIPVIQCIWRRKKVITSFLWPHYLTSHIQYHSHPKFFARIYIINLFSSNYFQFPVHYWICRWGFFLLLVFLELSRPTFYSQNIKKLEDVIGEGSTKYLVILKDDIHVLGMVIGMTWWSLLDFSSETKCKK